MPVSGNIDFGPAQSGLSAPGGLLDRLRSTMDQTSLNDATLQGYAPALRDTGIPVDPPQQGLFSRLLGAVGVPQSAPASPTIPMPLARQSPSTPATLASSGPASTGASSPMSGLMSYVGQAAQARGIDPMTAIRVAMSEGGASGGYGASGTGDGGSSFSQFQLHYGGVAGGGNSAAGLGDDFTAKTGLDARDPANAKAAIDFALDHASQNGWSAFHGAAKSGLAPFAGIGQAPAQGGGSASSAMAYAGPQSGPQAPAAGGAPQPMPQATAGVADPNGAGQLAVGGGGQMTGGSPNAPIPGPGGLTLQGGLTPAALGAMIQNPATRAQGLALWQQALAPKQAQFGKPGDAIVFNGRVTSMIPNAPMDVAPAHAVINPNSGSTIAAVPAEQKPTETGRDAYGQPTYGAFNPTTGAVAPFAGAPGVVPGANDASAGLTGPDFLKTLPPQIAGPVQAIAEGRMPMPAGQGANSPIAQRIRSAVLQYKPDYDVTDTQARAETRKDFASGNTAGVVTAGNAALQHLGHLSDAGEALTASQIPLINSAGQAIQTAGGANIAGKQYNGALNDFVGELTKFYRGTGGTEADIDSAKALLAPNQSPAQRRASIAQQATLIQSKVNALQARWHQGMGPQASDYPLIQPVSADAMSRIGARWSSDGSSGQAAGPVPVASPAGAPPGAGAMPTLTSPAQVRQLPSGTKFRTPDGRIGTAP